MTRAEISVQADAVLEAVAGASVYEGREERAISDVRWLARQTRELLALERVVALEHFRVESYREQGFSDCDVCGKLAVFTWERSAAQRKKMAGRKIKGARMEVLPVSWRCETHVPVAFPVLARTTAFAAILGKEPAFLFIFFTSRIFGHYFLFLYLVYGI